MQRLDQAEIPLSPDPAPALSPSPGPVGPRPARAHFPFDSLITRDLLDFAHHLTADGVRDRIELLVDLPGGLPFIGERLRAD
jgi:hypothetical protein